MECFSTSFLLIRKNVDFLYDYNMLLATLTLSIIFMFGSNIKWTYNFRFAHLKRKEHTYIAHTHILKILIKFEHFIAITKI